MGKAVAKQELCSSLGKGRRCQALGAQLRLPQAVGCGARLSKLSNDRVLPATEQAAGAGTSELLPATASRCLMHIQFSTKEHHRHFLPVETATTKIWDDSLKNASSNLSF